MDGGYNDVGLRILRGDVFYNFTLYILRGIEEGISYGGRFGLTPFNNPYTSLRSSDQLKEVADSFARMTDILSTDFSKMKELIDNLSIDIVDPKVKDKADILNQLISNYKFK